MDAFLAATFEKKDKYFLQPEKSACHGKFNC
jgi:hypothetical protein